MNPKSFGRIRRLLDLAPDEQVQELAKIEAEAASTDNIPQAAPKPAMALSSISLRPLKTEQRRDWFGQHELGTGQAT